MASCPVVTFMPITWFMLGVFLSLDERDSTAMHGSALQVADLLCELFCNVTRLVSVVHDDLPPCESSDSLILTGYALYSQSCFLWPLVVFAAAGFASRTRYLFGRMSIQMKVHAGDSSGTVSTFYVSTSTCLFLHCADDYAARMTLWQLSLQWRLKTGQGACAFSRKSFLLLSMS